jgi:hypothetical protein
MGIDQEASAAAVEAYNFLPNLVCTSYEHYVSLDLKFACQQVLMTNIFSLA